MLRRSVHVHHRRIRDQVVARVLAGGVRPRERRDGLGVVRAHAPRRCEAQGGGSRTIVPRETHRLAVDGVVEAAIERGQLVAELRERVERTYDGPLEVRVDLRGRIVVAVDVAADIGALEQLHVVAAGERAENALR